MDILQEAKRVFNIEITYLSKIMDTLDERFVAIAQEIFDSKGKVIVTGMGKPGHIARKIAATMSSLGTPAIYLHPAEALHGDLGMVEQKDIVIIISNSGESAEITQLIPNIKSIGAKIIAISSNANSTLCKYADLSYVFDQMREACALNLAPTTSTTCELVFGDALCVVLSEMQGFDEKQYAIFHPQGSLGKQLLLKVMDIMRIGDQFGIVSESAYLGDVIAAMCRSLQSIVSVVDNTNKLIGVFSDGDLRRLLNARADIYNIHIYEVMTKTPKAIDAEALAIDALKEMEKYAINAMPVLQSDGTVSGTIVLQDIMKAGIF